MTKLEKNALVNIVLATVFVFIGLLFFSILRKTNTQGIMYVIIVVVAGGPTLLAGVLLQNKIEAKFDEREKFIGRKAFRWSTYVLTIYALLLCFIPFFIIGGKGSIQVYYLPVFFFIGLFIGQLTESAIILIMCSLERQGGE